MTNLDSLDRPTRDTLPCDFLRYSFNTLFNQHCSFFTWTERQISDILKIRQDSAATTTKSLLFSPWGLLREKNSQKNPQF